MRFGPGCLCCPTGCCNFWPSRIWLRVTESDCKFSHFLVGDIFMLSRFAFDVNQAEYLGPLTPECGAGGGFPAFDEMYLKWTCVFGPGVQQLFRLQGNSPNWNFPFATYLCEEMFPHTFGLSEGITPFCCDTDGFAFGESLVFEVTDYDPTP